MADDEPLPTGIQLSSLDETYRERPHPWLDALRVRDPAHRDAVLGRQFLTREADIARILKDRSLSVEVRNADPDSYLVKIFMAESEERPRAPSILSMDDPDHARLRGLVTQAFNLRSIEALRPRIRETAETLLDALPADGEFDLIEGFAAPLPQLVIAEMLGIDTADRPQFNAWSRNLDQVFNPVKTPEQRAVLRENGEALSAYLAAAVEARRAERRGDLISAMIAAEEDGDRMTTAEIVTMCELLLVAGNLTTTDLIGNAVATLLEHPGELAKLRANPGLMGQAVEEVLRYDPPVTQTGRIATAPMEVSGTMVTKGTSMTLSILAANHDPAVHDDPHAFRIERKSHAHHAFGGGIHTCLGAPLARAEAQEGLAALLARYPVLEFADRPRPRKAAPAFSGFGALWLKGRAA